MDGVDLILEDFLLKVACSKSDNLVKLSQIQLPPDNISASIASLLQVEADQTTAEGEDEELKWTVLTKLVCSLRERALEVCIRSAIDISLSLQYWNDLLQRSRRRGSFGLYYYSLQTFPLYAIRSLRERTFMDFMNHLTKFPSAGGLNLLLRLRTDVRNRREYCLNALNQLAAFVGLLNQQNLPVSLKSTDQLCKYSSETIQLVNQCLSSLIHERQLPNVVFHVPPPSNSVPSGDPERLSLVHRIGSEEMLLPFIPFMKHQPQPQQEGNNNQKELVVKGLMKAALNLDQTMGSSTLVTLAEKPPYLARKWPKILMYTTIAYFSISLISSNLPSIVDLAKNLSGTVKDFMSVWIVDPLKYIWKTIKQEETLKLTSGTESLAKDLESLERMVAEYVQETGLDAAAIAEKVRIGDISVVMKQYEDELKTPVKSLLMGDLMRIILIQVQKAKVDLETAMQALDSVLRSQQLNFAFLAVAPTLIITGGLIRLLWSLTVSYDFKSKRKYFVQLKNGLREIDKILTANHDKECLPCKANGYVIIQTHVMERQIKSIPYKSELTSFLLEDLAEMRSNDITNPRQKYLIMKRMIDTLKQLL